MGDRIHHSDIYGKGHKDQVKLVGWIGAEALGETRSTSDKGKSNSSPADFHQRIPHARQAQARLSVAHSCRSAVVGSTLLARKAGTKPANPAANVRMTAEQMNVNGSRALNP